MFESKYKWRISKDEYCSDNMSRGRRTILPFFGFSHGTESESYTDTYGGNVVATKVGEDSYKIEKTPSGIYTRYRYYETFKRAGGPSCDEAAQIESSMVAYLKKKNIDIQNSYYICCDVDEYHREYGETKNSSSLFAIAIISTVLGIAAGCYIMFGLQELILSKLPAIFEYVYKYFAAAPIVLGFAIAIFCLIKRGIGNKRLRRTPLSELDEEYVTSVTKRYHGTMTGVYGKELGALMVRYTELRK